VTGPVPARQSPPPRPYAPDLCWRRTGGDSVTVRIAVDDRDAVRVVSMAGDDGLNFFGADDRRRLDATLAAADHDDGIRVVILQGTERSFSVGADLGEFPASPGDPTDFVESALVSASTPERMRKPVLAAVEGMAIAGGFELALSCDWIFASCDARFRLPEASFGLVAGYAAARLTGLIGSARARRLLMTCEELSAEDAERLGLHVTVKNRGEALDGALEMAKMICRSAPHAVRLIKQRSVAQAMAQDPDFRVSLSAYGQLWNAPDTTEAMIAFRDRRTPVFRPMDRPWQADLIAWHQQR
jgi:enoyl-CoA hydratase/carnithine racemase